MPQLFCSSLPAAQIVTKKLLVLASMHLSELCECCWWLGWLCSSLSLFSERQQHANNKAEGGGGGEVSRWEQETLVSSSSLACSHVGGCPGQKTFLLALLCFAAARSSFLGLPDFPLLIAALIVIVLVDKPAQSWRVGRENLVVGGGHARTDGRRRSAVGAMR